MCLVLSREASPISKGRKAGFVVVRGSSYLHFREQDYLCGPRNVFKKKIVLSVLLPKKDGNGLTLSYNLEN